MGISEQKSGHISIDFDSILTTENLSVSMENRMQDMIRQAEQSKADQQKKVSLATASFIPQGDVFLQDVKNLIQQGRYQEALAMLANILSIRPDACEARYLSALCRYHLDEYEGALRDLSLMEGKEQPKDLAESAKSLLSSIRGAMLLPVLLNVVILIQLRQFDGAVELMRRYIQIDRSNATYYYILGGAYLNMSEPGKARQTVDEANLRCPAADLAILSELEAALDRREMTALCAKIAATLILKGAQDARALFRIGAAKSMGTDLYKAMDCYLGDYDQIPLAAYTEAAAKAKPYHKDSFYEALLADEIKAAQDKLQKGELSGARTALTHMKRLAPYSSHYNFFQAVYLIQDVRMGNDLDHAEDSAQAAALCLGRVTIPEAMATVAQMKSLLKVSIEDAKITKLIREFNSRMESLSNPPTLNQLRELKAFLNAMAINARDLRRIIVSADTKRLDDLMQAVQTYLMQLGQLNFL